MRCSHSERRRKCCKQKTFYRYCIFNNDKNEKTNTKKYQIIQWTVNTHNVQGSIHLNYPSRGVKCQDLRYQLKLADEVILRKGKIRANYEFLWWTNGQTGWQSDPYVLHFSWKSNTTKKQRTLVAAIHYVFCTWLFFFRTITFPSWVSNSPWSTRHRTWKFRSTHLFLYAYLILMT